MSLQDISAGNLLFLNSTIARSIGGVLMILMGLQLLHVYKPPIRGIFNFFRVPTSYTVVGAFLLGLSFEGITIGRGAPMLVIVLTYIALSQTMVQRFFTMLIYGAGLSIPLIVISSIGGPSGRGSRNIPRSAGMSPIGS